VPPPPDPVSSVSSLLSSSPPSPLSPPVAGAATLTVWRLPRAVYDRAVVTPIYRLYRNGPALHGYGFWRGAPSPEVCASLTNVESKFWTEHPHECETLIGKEVEAYVVLMETVIYFAAVAWTVRATVAWACNRVRLRDYDSL